MRIAVDVMGGDHGCGVIIAGVKRALEEQKDISTIYLVGNRADIHAALPERGFRDHRVKVIHTTEVVEMDESFFLRRAIAGLSSISTTSVV
jgi:glycerol-3-phosphate acyltransferase PlsX